MPAPRVDSEVGALRSVLLHRPGAELARLTPRNAADLLFDGVPWVERAQEEHDAFAAALRARGVEVLSLDLLLTEVLSLGAAREELVSRTVRPAALGPSLAEVLRAQLLDLAPAELATALVAGVVHSEVAGPGGLVSRVSGPTEFAVPPLPNLLFTRDTAVRVGGSLAVAVPSLPARTREAALVDVVWRHHPRLSAVPRLPGAELGAGGAFEGGDVLVLGPGILAVGMGSRTTPAGVEDFAARVFAAGEASVVLAVPISQERATMHLDTVCTMVDRDAVVMYPALAGGLEAWLLEPGPDATGVSVDGPLPFLAAAAAALGIDELRVIDTGLDPVTAEREQWDDGCNTLAIAPGSVVAYERNVRTNARLEAAGIEVVRIAGSELGSGRGGPRCMSCPVERAPLP